MCQLLQGAGGQFLPDVLELFSKTPVLHLELLIVRFRRLEHRNDECRRTLCDLQDTRGEDGHPVFCQSCKPIDHSIFSPARIWGNSSCLPRGMDTSDSRGLEARRLGQPQKVIWQRGFVVRDHRAEDNQARRIKTHQTSAHCLQDGPEIIEQHTTARKER